MCPIQVRLDAKAAARAVSLDVSDLAPADAVGAVLKSSGLDFAMHTRCGTLTQPALVVVRLAGDGPIVSLAPRVDSDDPRVKQAIADELPCPFRVRLPNRRSARTRTRQQEGRYSPGRTTGASWLPAR